MLENEKLREQLQSFLTQYEVRDKHFEQQIQAKEAEKLIAEEKHAKASAEIAETVRRGFLFPDSNFPALLRSSSPPITVPSADHRPAFAGRESLP